MLGVDRSQRGEENEEAECVGWHRSIILRNHHLPSIKEVRESLAKTLPKVGEIGVWFGRRSGGTFHQVLWKESRSFGMDLFLHPIEKRAEVALLRALDDFRILHRALLTLR